MPQRSARILLGAIPALAFAVDRATKIFARDLVVTSGTPLQTGIIDTVVHENRGIIANIPVPLPIIILLTIAVIAILALLWTRALANKQTLAAVGLGLIIGGAASNLFDRIVAGYVYDWILLFGRSAINAADAMIVVGAILLGIGMKPRGVVRSIDG